MKASLRKVRDNTGIVHWSIESLADDEKGHYVAVHSLPVFMGYEVLDVQDPTKVTCLVCLAHWT